MGWVDSDAHVVETPQTWEYLDASEAKYRPMPVQSADGLLHWFIDGKIRGLFRSVMTAQQFSELSRRFDRRIDTPRESYEMENIEARLRHMDELGIDIQVLYPTVFLEQCADRPDVDIAVCGSYNRWLADIWKQSGGRLRWMAVLPLLSMSDALDQLKFCKDNGACGVFVRPVEGNRIFHDPYFYPLYEEASRLDLCIGVHQANANPGMVDMLSGHERSGERFMQYRIFTVGAFFVWIRTGLPAVFPNLRLGFIETAASWIPWAVMELRGRMDTVETRLPDNPLEAYNMYVTCQNGDDIPYLLSHAGENRLVIGTDYGHVDSSTDIEGLRTLETSGRISPEAARKILDDNGRAFYGLGAAAGQR